MRLRLLPGNHMANLAKKQFFVKNYSSRRGFNPFG
jgi:hypothetical protein